jgi:coenzyme F420-0:L-glutamate ligase/coenzyme F420-1:gamma-L-glutamate ligase
LISVLPIAGVGEISEGDDLAALIYEAARSVYPEPGDVFVVTQKVVSKSEGRAFPESEKERLVRAETRRILRRQGTMLICETHQGFVCANAGIDSSNVPEGEVVALPVDPDASARRLRARLEHLSGLTLGVVISDTFGRAWRLGQTDVAIGVAGIHPFVDHVGKPDANGRIMTATRICIADQIAGAAEMAMGKTENICAAVVRGAPVTFGRGSATQIVRSPGDDLFR